MSTVFGGKSAARSASEDGRMGAGGDQNGNRDCPEGSAAYDDQDRLQVCNGIQYTYDDNGSLTSRDADTFDYDVMGNLLTATVAGTTVDYLIDGENRRVGRTVNGVTTRYVYQDQLRIAAELDEAGNIVSEFFYRDSPNMPEFMVRGGVTYRIVTDHLGSPREVIDEQTGTVVFAAMYSAWGERDVTVGSEEFLPFGFAGGLLDVATGLVRFGARDYDSATGRWTAKDPILWKGGQSNLYVYVANDPINRLDPTGLDECSYYDGRCEVNGGDYYCSMAPWWCEHFGHSTWANCTRDCLQDCDANQNPDGQSSPSYDDEGSVCPTSREAPANEGPFDPRSDNFACHLSCYLGCGLGPGSPWQALGPTLGYGSGQ